MKTTKIKIKNLFGISETELDGSSIEITGTNGAGKTSRIDSIRYALTNSSERDFVIKNGETEGEILIETDSGLYINRKKREGQSDYKSIKENGRDVLSPESFLSQLFTPLQLDPVAFTQMTKKEQNRIVLDLIEFDWDLNWIKEQFGEIPSGINYEQNILQVLSDIQAESGEYFQGRQDVNRDVRNRQTIISDIAKDLPDGYRAEEWEKYDLGGTYRKIETIKAENNKVLRAKEYLSNYDNKIRGFQAKKEIAISAAEKTINNERTSLLQTIERLKAEIIAAEDKLGKLDETLSDKMAVINSEYEADIAKLDGDMKIAEQYSVKSIVDCSDLESEVKTAEEMKKHLNEYYRMSRLDEELETLREQSEEYTRKIELARNLPGEILKTATIPIEGFAVENGIPLINGLPISNLSEGEKLSLCVDVALSKPNSLQIILIDGSEKLSDKNRELLYSKCKDKGLQFIATRTTNSDCLEVNYL